MTVIKRLSHYTPSPMIKEVVEEQLASMKQGIVTILRSDPETPTKSNSSIRRTLSADMSSKNWLAQNGFSAHPPPQSNPGQDDVWRSIQSIKDQPEPILDLILTKQRAPHGNDKPPCYVPPLTKRLSSTKSLEICTESLGSETGSDSLYSTTPRSESSDDHQERQRISQTRGEEEEEEHKDSIFCETMSVVKYKNAPLRPFPPPIRSISSVGDSLQVQPRRENGRLVLEAVSVPPKNYFCAQRSNGRLVLTLIHHRKASTDRALDDENKEGQDKHDVVERELGSFLPPPSRIISVHKPSLVMKTTFISSGNRRNPSWVGNKTVKIIEGEERDELRISQSLPPPLPRVSSWIIHKPQPPSSFDGNEYFWGNKAATVSKGGFINPVVVNNTMNMRRKNDDNDKVYVAKQYTNRELVVTMRRGGKVESFVPYSKGCKEPKRLIVTWEPYCIATS